MPTHDGKQHRRHRSKLRDFGIAEQTLMMVTVKIDRQQRAVVVGPATESRSSMA